MVKAAALVVIDDRCQQKIFSESMMMTVRHHRIEAK